MDQNAVHSCINLLYIRNVDSLIAALSSFHFSEGISFLLTLCALFTNFPMFTYFYITKKKYLGFVFVFAGSMRNRIVDTKQDEYENVKQSIFCLCCHKCSFADKLQSNVKNQSHTNTPSNFGQIQHLLMSVTSFVCHTGIRTRSSRFRLPGTWC